MLSQSPDHLQSVRDFRQPMGRAVKELEEKALVRVYHSFGKGRQHNNSYELLPLGSAPSPLVTER